MTSTERAFSDTLSLLTDFQSPLKLCTAFSGGCDSLALLILCVKTLGKENVKALYVNHRLRDDGELEKEIALNMENCRKLGIPLAVISLEKDEVKNLAAERRGGLEDAARVLRYRALEEFRVKEGCSYTVTAHHRQDQVETVLMKIIRGAPASSLRGISEINNNIIRPLLDFSKEELSSYVKSEGFSWSEDSTNALPHFERNRLRNSLIPALSEVMEDYEERILKIRDKAVSMCFSLPEVEIEDGRMDRSAFTLLNEAEKTLLLYRLWDSVFGYKSMPQSLVKRVLNALKCTNSCTIDANGAHISIGAGTIIITDAEEDKEFENFCEKVDRQGSTALPGGLFCFADECGPETDIRLPEALVQSGKLAVRFVKTGDFIVLKEGRKTVLKLLQDMKIPASLRVRVPLLCDSDGVCAVAAGCLGGRNRVAKKYLNSSTSVFIRFSR